MGCRAGFLIRIDCWISPSERGGHSGRIMVDGPAENEDVKEFYLGMSSEGRKSFRDMKSYRRRKRWV